MQHSLHTLITSDNATGSNTRLFVIKDSAKDFVQSGRCELTHWQTRKAQMARQSSIRHLHPHAALAAIKLGGGHNA